MRTLLPTIVFKGLGEKLAPRPKTLDGLTIGFLDGWGQRLEDGSFDMYPLMRELLKEIQKRFNIAGYVWEKKPNISTPVSEPQLSNFLAKVDVVINGECA